MIVRSSILELKLLTKSFGALAAVDRLNLTVEEGERRSVIGPNGAGKTTLFNLVTGRLKPSSGQVLFKGKRIEGQPPHAIARAGISRSFQKTNVFPKLTVFESMRVAAMARSGKNYSLFSSADKLTGVTEKAWRILKEIGLEEKGDAQVGTLSYGEQRQLEIGITIANEPELIMLDEPTAGMSREETSEIVDLIKKVSAGKTLILIEHDMDVVFSISDRITVMTYGRAIAEGKPEEIRQMEEVKKAYLGETKDQWRRATVPAPREGR